VECTHTSDRYMDSYCTYLYTEPTEHQQFSCGHHHTNTYKLSSPKKRILCELGGADAPAPPGSNQIGALSQIGLDHHGIIKQLELVSIIIMQQQQEQASTATSRRRTTKLLTDYPCISNK